RPSPRPLVARGRWSRRRAPRRDGSELPVRSRRRRRRWPWRTTSCRRRWVTCRRPPRAGGRRRAGSGGGRSGGRRGRPGAGRRLSSAALRGAVNRFPRLPHGAPFLLLDQVLEIEERRGAFLKLVSAADPCVGRDGLLPAAFVLEALAQAGGALVAAQHGKLPAAGYLAAVDEFRVHGEVRVGDALRVEVEVVRVFAS